MNTGPPCPACKQPSKRTKKLIPGEMIHVCLECKRYSAPDLTSWLTDDGNPRMPVLEHLRRLIELHKEELARQKAVWDDPRAWDTWIQ
jgi:hypothetical protein